MGMRIGDLGLLLLDSSENAAEKVIRKDGEYGFLSTLAQITEVAS